MQASQLETFGTSRTPVYETRIATDTYLGIRLLVVRGETLDTSFSKLGCQAGRADLTPVVRLDARGDLEDGLEGGHV
jgi:hypothetical protein